MNELLKKMLLSEKSGENKSSSEMDMDASFWKTELECPICFEEMKPPMRIWQCVDGHPVCEGDHHLLNLMILPGYQTSTSSSKFHHLALVALLVALVLH